MRPPICAICGKDFRADMRQGGQLSFRLSEKDKAHNERLRSRGMTGHPGGTEWFCNTHLAIAKKFTDLSLSEALPKIRSSSSWFSRIQRIFRP